MARSFLAAMAIVLAVIATVSAIIMLIAGHSSNGTFTYFVGSVSGVVLCVNARRRIGRKSQRRYISAWK